MKKYLALALTMIISVSMLFAQDMKKFKLYKPDEDAEKKIEDAIKQAAQEKKHVFIQIGGNWCIWCARFHDFITKDKEIDSLIKANFVVYHLNYSPENENKKLLARYGYPQRFGFPVFLVLDGTGNLLHTQNSVYLEDGDLSYVKKEVIGFFKDWSPSALDPANYKK